MSSDENDSVNSLNAMNAAPSSQIDEKKKREEVNEYHRQISSLFKEEKELTYA